MAAKRTPFVTDKDATILFVKLNYSGIHRIALLCDGLPLTFFGKGKTAYMRVTEVIAWHEKELSESKGTSGSQDVLDSMRKALEKFRNGEMVFS